MPHPRSPGSDEDPPEWLASVPRHRNAAAFRLDPGADGVDATGVAVPEPPCYSVSDPLEEDADPMLGPAAAADWLGDAVVRLAMRAAELVPDSAILDWLLLGRGREDYWNLRQASLLAGYLGRAAEASSLLEQARTAYIAFQADNARHEASYAAFLGRDLDEAHQARLSDTRWDRRFEPFMWTPKRFEAFFVDVEL